MIAVLLFAAATVDPRPALLALQLQNRTRDALALAQRELEQHPAVSRSLGLDYLRGHLLHLLGEAALAGEAFGAAMVNTPDLALYSRYRMAWEQAEMNHPEVAAGLVSSAVAQAPASPLADDAVRLLSRTLAMGGDCRLLGGIAPEKLTPAPRRTLLLSQADCSLRGGHRELARYLLVRILQENGQDDAGRAAAERLAGLISDGERGRTALLLGMAFQLQRDFARSLRLLQQALDGGDTLPEREVREARFLQAHAQLSQERYGPAALLFGSLAQRAGNLRERARALYQQGRSYELQGSWQLAAASFQLAYQADPASEWAAPSLLSMLRLQWRGTDEASAATLFYMLLSRPEWRESAFRAGLFMAASDIARGRGERAGAWLDRIAPATADDRLELSYWRGRLAELNRDFRGAVAADLEVLRTDLYHPLARMALARLAAEPLAPAAREEGLRLAGSRRPQDLYGAWLLLGDRDASGQAARTRLLQLLSAVHATRPFVRLAEAPIGSWPLWKKPLPRAEDKLLALGMWHEGAPAVRDQFPIAEPSLGLTGSLFLARGGEHSLSIQQAELLLQRTPAAVPLAIQPRVLHVVLYPNPYRAILIKEGRLRGIDPDLLAALIREESRFDPYALSPEAERGLLQLDIPTAQRLGSQINLRVEPDDLFRPEVAAALGAAALSMLQRDLGGLDYQAVTAYEAGVPQTQLWRSWCFAPGRFDEYFTKIGEPDIRAYLRRVLTSRAHYAELY